MYATARHPALESIIQLQIQHVKDRYYGTQSCEPTGPVAYFNGLQNYLKSCKSAGIKPPQRDVRWMKTGNYYAIHDYQTISFVLVLCNEINISILNKLFVLIFVI